jgi:prephenate dehydrogenase
LNSEYIESFHKKLVSKGRVDTDKKKENMRRKERKLSEQLDASDLIAGLHPQDNPGDASVLRSLLSARSSLLFPLQSSNKDKMVKRIDVLKHVIRASMEKAQKELEVKLNKPFASAVSSHVEVGIRTALKLGMTMLKSMASTNPDLLLEVIDLFGETFSQYPALCIRDPSNFELDALYHDGSHFSRIFSYDC